MYKDYRNIKYRKYFQLRQMDGLICFNIKKKISTLIKKLLDKRFVKSVHILYTNIHTVYVKRMFFSFALMQRKVQSM